MCCIRLRFLPELLLDMLCYAVSAGSHQRHHVENDATSQLVGLEPGVSRGLFAVQHICIYIYTYTRSPHIYRPFSHRIFTARIHLHRACLAVESTVSSVSSSRSTQTTMQNASKCHFKWIQMAHTLIFRSLNQLAILVKLHYHSRLLGPALGCSRHQESKAIVL